MTENKDYLETQIITYLGNKRSLLSFINKSVEIVKEELNQNQLRCLDLFSGSGIVARLLKQHSSYLAVNDLEEYSQRINSCYLMNESEVNKEQLDYYFNFVKQEIEKGFKDGFIRKLYSPIDENNITSTDRVFYTNRNASFLDTAAQLIQTIPEPYQTLLMAPLLSEASIKVNTSGVFKGFYKDANTKLGQFGGTGRAALSRIMSDIELNKPVLSNYSCMYDVYNEDSNTLVEKIHGFDLVYLDPPYNQHPYGSNYFMLNLINSYIEPEKISKVSGIPADWNRSDYNKKAKAISSLEDLCRKIDTKYLLISFSSEGFISYDEMVNMLSQFGEVRVFEQKYNVFRAARNLEDRDKHLKEYLYLVRKEIK